VPKALGNWDFNLKSSPNFAINYFGYGNNSLNNDELNGMDYNSANKNAQINTSKKNRIWKHLLSRRLESYDIEQTNNRFVAIPNSVNPRVLKSTICWSQHKIQL
jgi:hypothetical protein